MAKMYYRKENQANETKNTQHDDGQKSEMTHGETFVSMKKMHHFKPILLNTQ